MCILFFETMPLEPDEKKNIEYISFQYIAFGDIGHFKKTVISDVNFLIAHAETEAVRNLDVTRCIRIPLFLIGLRRDCKKGDEEFESKKSYGYH